ncbi:MAG: DNA repair protein RecO [bacterium]|nr:DNA repair protein RecO [bacterium]
MPLRKTEGIVLSTRAFSESSKILTLFTREYGKVAILVKGGRKGTKKFPGGLETLNCVDLQYYHKGGREIQNFKSFDLVEPYLTIRGDLVRTYTALSLVETVLRTTIAEDKNEQLFDNLVMTLGALDVQDQRPWAIRWKCLLEICGSLGFGLQLMDCANCSGAGPMIGFDLASGGFICEREALKQNGVIAASGEVWGILRYLEKCPPESAVRVATQPRTGRKIEQLFLQYFRYHIPSLNHFESWKKLPEIYWGEEKEN